MKTVAIIAISVGVFFVGIGVSYAIFTSTYDPNTMKFHNQELFDQMMSQNPKMTANWMETMMQDTQFHDQAMEGDEAKIRELISEYQIALNKEEIEKISTLYSKQAIFMPPEIPAINGVEEIVLTYEYLFSQFDFELEFDIKQVVISENFAYLLSNSEGTITLESSGTEETSKNQEIFILIKEGDDWKISRYMFNSLS